MGKLMIKHKWRSNSSNFKQLTQQDKESLFSFNLVNTVADLSGFEQ